MICKFCENEFNSEPNTPRMLISCGHSICEECLR